MANAINWFEIPATDIDRARTFYGKVFSDEIQVTEMGGIKMAFLPGDYMNGELTGALCQGEGYEPTEKGSLLYLNGGEDLNERLSLAEKAGAKVLLPKTKISDEIGFMAIFLDSEGNRVAFHSPR